MVTAHLQTPMRDRVMAGSLILKHYQMSSQQNNLTSLQHIQPDIELLQSCIEKGEKAAIEGVESYVNQSF